MAVEFHQIEGYTLPGRSMSAKPSVVCSFKTEQCGYLQIMCECGNMKELDNEPSLFHFTPADRSYIEEKLLIVWRMLFDSTAATERFES